MRSIHTTRAPRVLRILFFYSRTSRFQNYSRVRTSIDSVWIANRPQSMPRAVLHIVSRICTKHPSCATTAAMQHVQVQVQVQVQAPTACMHACTSKCVADRPALNGRAQPSQQPIRPRYPAPSPSVLAVGREHRWIVIERWPGHCISGIQARGKRC